MRWFTGVIGMLAAAPAAAQDWRPLGFIGEGTADYVLIYLDVASVRKTGPTTREMTVANVYPASQALQNGQKFDWLQMTYTVDCTAREGMRLRSSAHIGPVPFLNDPRPGTTKVPLKSPTPLGRAATAACDGAYAYLWQATPAVIPQARTAFRWRDAHHESLASAEGWYRLGVEGKAPRRSAVFVHRPTIRVEGGGVKLASIVTVMEPAPDAKPGAPVLYTNRVRIDCTRRTQATVYSAVFDWMGEETRGFGIGGSFPSAQPLAMTGTGLFAAPYAPVCAADWSKGSERKERPFRFMHSAFAP